MKTINLHELETICFDAIVDRQPIQQFVNAFHASIRLPLLCLDAALRGFAYAFERPFYYVPWERAALGMLSDDEIISKSYLTTQEQMYRNQRAHIFDTGFEAEAPVSASPILISGNLVGYCGILVEDADREQVVAANDLLSRTLAVLLNMLNDSNSLDFSDESACTGLLRDDSASPQLLQRFEETFHPDYYFLILTDPSGSTSQLQYCRKNLCFEGSGCIGCVSGQNSLYLLLSGVGEASPAQAAEAPLRMAEKFHLIVSGSDRFSRREEIPAHRKQAELALSFSRDVFPEQHVCFFAEHFPGILAYCARSWYGPDYLGCSDLRLLEEYDRSNGTELVSCLHFYLKNFCNAQLTAEKMGMHKNTVNYRLRKIEDLIDVRLDDPFMKKALLARLDYVALTRQLERSGK